MSPEVLHPATLEETLAVLEAYGEEARLLAGGTALVLLLRHGLIAPGPSSAWRKCPNCRASNSTRTTSGSAR